MYKRAVFHSIFLIMVLLLTSCSLGMNVTGSVVMLKGDVPVQPSAIEKVKIVLETKEADYQVIALINASVSVAETMDIAIAEGEALQELKNQAALAGANGVIEVVREMLKGDVLVSTTRYGGVLDPSILDHNGILGHDSNLNHNRNVIDPLNNSSRTSVSQSYTVYFRAKAVRF